MIFDIFSFLGGLSAKLYDDFNDNPLFLNLKNNKFLMELLKGLHYLSFISVGMEDNLYYVLFYIANVMNYLTSIEAFSEPYENSIIYTFLFGFFLLNYTKIYQSIQSIKIYSIDTVSYLWFIASMFIEPVMINKDLSLNKLCFRICCVLLSLLFYFICEIKTFKLIFIYVFGYLSCSCVIQYISLREEIKKLYKKNEQIHNEKNEENKQINITEDNIDEIIDIFLTYIGFHKS